MQCLSSGGSATCRTWPKISTATMEASRSELLLRLNSSSRTSSRPRQLSAVQCASASSSARIRRQISLSFGSVWASAVSTTFCGFHGRTAWHKQSSAGIGYKRARDIAAPAHLGALIAAKPCIQAVIQDAFTAGFLPKEPLETRLAAVIGTALSTYLDALDDEDEATAKLYVQKAAQAAAEAWQQTIGCLQYNPA